jgi:hypothetical protein
MSPNSATTARLLAAEGIALIEDIREGGAPQAHEPPPQHGNVCGARECSLLDFW